MGQGISFRFFDFSGDQAFRAEHEIPDDAVHVWRRSLAAEPSTVELAMSVLSQEERERALRYRVDHARHAFVLTRSALRLLLGAYLGKAPELIQFRLTEYGKPLLDEGFCFHFNVSHTDGLAVLAFARRRRVGVDVERIRPQPDALKLARRFFSEKEREELEGLSAEQLPAAFFRCWSRKEAYIKARGEGLSIPLDQFDVSTEESPSQILLATRPDPGDARRWLARDVPVPSLYVGTLAVCTLKE